MKMHTLILAAMSVVAFGAAAPADAQTRGVRPQPASASGQRMPETYDACVRRQLRLRDAVSGISIQPGDAGRFCNKRAQRY